MKKLFLAIVALTVFGGAASALAQAPASAQTPAIPQTIKLLEPDKTRGQSVMRALDNRRSVGEYSDRPLSDRDMSDLFWAAHGVNRPDGRRTAASAMNRQDVVVYAFTTDAVYRYNAVDHALEGVVAGDHRLLFGERGMSPLILLLVSDVSRFGDVGTLELRKEWGAIDVGLVAQNIALFCSGNGLGAKPRAGMDREAISKLLNLSELQLPMLNNTVGYPAE